MIMYPCKQDPTPAGGNLHWNHKWFYTEPPNLLGSLSGQQIRVVNGNSSYGVFGADYCLTTPATGGTYPTLTVCSTSADQLWTRFAKADTYASSWLFKDSRGRCIGLGDPLGVNEQGVYEPWTQMIVEVCSGGPEQKWNAPPTAQAASLDNFKELN
jgi:hypothetical protein